MLVTFIRFNERGMLRHRNSDDQHKEINPGNSGNRAITAQLLAAGLAKNQAATMSSPGVARDRSLTGNSDSPHQSLQHRRMLRARSSAEREMTLIVRHAQLWKQIPTGQMEEKHVMRERDAIS